MPLIRFEVEEKMVSKFQHLYMFLAFPLMQVVFQVSDNVDLFTKTLETPKFLAAAGGSTVIVAKNYHFMDSFGAVSESRHIYCSRGRCLVHCRQGYGFGMPLLPFLTTCLSGFEYGRSLERD